jgi:signal transduction histidine kinase
MIWLMTDHRRSARLRILGWILVPAALMLILSWVVARELLISQVETRIQQELAGEVSELRVLAAEGAPTTFEDGPGARALLRLYLDRSIPDRNETMFSIVDGVVDARTADVPLVRLDEDPRLVAELAALDEVTYGATDTGAGLVRYVAVPVSDSSASETGTLVVAIFADAESAEADSVIRTLLLTSLAGLALATGVGWLVAGRVLAPIRQMRDTAREITDTDLDSRIPLTGRADEFDDLATTFNAMLDRLQEAFASQREFVDDAGHELRTPLTIVRGHLELLQGATDPEDRAQLMTVITDELARMARIVHDLQTLTKSNQPGFLRRAPLDVADLVDDVLVRAHALGDRDWRLDARCEGVIEADRDRVTQALIQLAQNATQHTAIGDEIGIGCRDEGTAVCFWVRDTGVGIQPKDRERVFQRFARADGPRTEGAGLGLSIVAAIAYTHGGTISVVETDGGGATFEMRLPTFEPEDGSSRHAEEVI